MDRNEIIEALVEAYGLEYPDRDDDGFYILDGSDWNSGCGLNGYWLSLKEIVLILSD